MDKVTVIRRFFGDTREVTSKELMDLRRGLNGQAAFNEVATLAAAEMGVSLDEKAEEVQH